jgi:chemotaxis protein histidine kinase CheA
MADVEFIQIPNTLRKAKIGNGPGKLDKTLLANAEKAIEAFGEGFSDWIQDDIDAMEAARLRLSQGEDAERALADLYRIALDLKGQGASFGYDVVSAVGASLTDFLDPVREGKTNLSPLQLDVVTAHVGAIRAVISEGLKDDGGATGQALLNGLARIVAKAHAAAGP